MKSLKTAIQVLTDFLKFENKAYFIIVNIALKILGIKFSESGSFYLYFVSLIVLKTLFQVFQVLSL